MTKFEHNRFGMSKKEIIEKIINAINQLPQEKAEEISNFTDYIYNQYEVELLRAGMVVLTDESNSFEFIKNEDDVYTLADVKKIYND